MKSERLEKLIQLGEEVDKKWEPYVSEHVQRSRDAYADQQNIIQEISIMDCTLTRMSLMSTIQNIAQFNKEQHESLSSAINTTSTTIKSSINSMFHETLNFVSQVQRSILIEGHVALNKVSKTSVDGNNDACSITASPSLKFPGKDSHTPDLLPVLEESREYSLLFWSLRAESISKMIASWESDLVTLHCETSEKLKDLSALCTSHESQIQATKQIIQNKRENIGRLISDTQIIEGEIEELEVGHHTQLKELVTMQDQLAANQKNHEKTMEQISFEGNLALEELEMIILHLEKLQRSGLKSTSPQTHNRTT